MSAEEARRVLDQHRPELYVSTRDGHRECYCGHVLATDETFASHLADALAMRRVTCDHDAQIRDLLEEREELLTEIRRLRMGNHPAGRALAAARLEPTQRDAIVVALREALTERDAEHEGGEGA